MSDRLHRLVYGVRAWTDTEESLRARFEAHLLRCRRRRVTDLMALRPEHPPDPEPEQLPLPFEPTISAASYAEAEEHAAPVDLSWQDKTRIRDRVRRLHARRHTAAGMYHLKEADQKVILGRLSGVRLAGPQTEHDADAMASALMNEAPWMQEAIRHVWSGARRSAREGCGLGFSPILIDGPPGLGKSHLARRIAELAGVPFVSIDLGAGTEAFAVAGVARGWSSAMPGRPLETILSSGIGNVLAFVDEVDKGGAIRSENGTSTSAWNALLGLLDPGSARSWSCPYYRLTLDLSCVCWVLAGNDMRFLPAPLLSRVTVIRARRPTPEEMVRLAWRVGRERGIDDDSLQLLTTSIWRARGDITIRTIMRALDGLRAASERGVLH